MTQPLIVRGQPPRSTAVALLQAQQLPVADITDEHLEHFCFAGSDGSPTGLVGLELDGADALLRSLVEHAEQYASSKGVRSMSLLTTTAAAFFKRLGYERLDRCQAPPSIERTREFASLCPASSAFMVKTL